MEDQYNKVGFMQRDDDSMLRRLHRINIVQWSCAVDNENCLSQVKTLFNSWMSQDDPDSSNP